MRVNNKRVRRNIRAYQSSDSLTSLEYEVWREMLRKYAE